jgi:hypothetical protein
LWPLILYNFSVFSGLLELAFERILACCHLHFVRKAVSTFQPRLWLYRLCALRVTTSVLAASFAYVALAVVLIRDLLDLWIRALGALQFDLFREKGQFENGTR